MRHRLHALTAACGLALTTPASAQTLPATFPSSAPTQSLPSPQDPILQQKLDLLRQRIAERDQLQREIDQLIVETQTPQRMTVHFELLEVDVSAATKLDLMPSGRQLNGSLANRLAWTPDDLEKLRREGAVQTLAAPSVAVASGEQSTTQYGPARTNSEENGPQAPSTDFQVRADSLGANQVQVDFRINRTSSLDGKATKNIVPTSQQLTISSRMAIPFGEAKTFGGLVSERTRTRRGALGRVTETVMVETVLLIRVDAEMPETAGVIPATAIAPR